MAAQGITLQFAPDRGPNGPDDRALRLDFDFAGRGGWAGTRRALRLTLPEHFELRLALRGAAPPNNLEIKLIDPGGENVWWVTRRDFELPRHWQTLRFKRRHFRFAWGPAGGGEVREVGAIEIVVTAGQGGRGSLWLDDLEIAVLPPPAPLGPLRPTSSPSAPGAGPELALDGDRTTVWRSAGTAGAWLTLDFGGPREFGGLALHWAPGGEPRGYALEGSLDGEDRPAVATVVNETNGGSDWLFLPDSEARRLTLGLDGCAPAGCALAELELLPLEAGESPNAFFLRLAAEARPGAFPRAFAGQQSYWTVVGADGAAEEALLSEDGQLELARAGPSLEPFLWVDGRLFAWSDVEISHQLTEQELPIPTVVWHAGDLELEITAFADGSAEDSTLWARYRLRSTARAAREATLFLALRPLQVNPPSQFLGTPGGVARLDAISVTCAQGGGPPPCPANERGRVVWNGERVIELLEMPTGSGVTAFDAGEIHEYLRLGRLPARLDVEDGRRWASAALRWDLELEAGATRDVWIAAPLAATAGARAPLQLPGEPAAAAQLAEQRLAAALAAWRSRLGALEIRLPPGRERYARTLRSTLGWILVHRDGAAIQPGSRAYERSWIRDGALTSSALLRSGLVDEARAFTEWFAGFQYPSGAVPCCVDRRGADPVPEHDSHGELIHAIAETWRFTRDRGFLVRQFPHVERAVAHVDRLRAQRRTPEYASGERRIFFGLLPESISHEGYSARPVHSYWDDFFALRGLKDAVELATALGEKEKATAFARSRDEFTADLHASIQRVIAERRIDYIPGSADLADLDATSTTIALAPGGEQERLPPRELERTFERYWEEFVARRDGGKEWDAYTPYELRNVGAFVRLGWRGRAHELLHWFMDHRRPAEWNEWAEVVGRDPREPRFIGDMPHGWVGSDYIRSFLDLLAYEREEDQAIVVGAGIPEEWLVDGGCRLRGLRTRYGKLDLAFSKRGAVVTVRIDGDAEPPPGGFVVRLPGRFASATIDGRRARLEPDGFLQVRALPASIELH